MTPEYETDLTKTLLGLYECAVAPDRYPDFARNLEALLRSAPDASTLGALEHHSEMIWDKAVNLFLSEADDPLAEDHLLDIDTRRPGAPEVVAFLDRLPADDVTRLTALIDGQASEPQLVIRAETDDVDALAFHLARREGDRIQVFRLRNDLAAEAEALLVSQFRITASEMQVLRGLVSGHALKKLADESGKSIETIRSQTKSIAAKLGFSRQNEISAAVHSISRVASRGRSPRRADGLSSITLRDGREMHFSRIGALDGMPVLFFHDFSSSCRWPQTVAAQFAQAGLEVISPARAGFGHSTANRLTQLALFEDHLADYGELMDRLGLGACRMMAFGTGFGLAHSLCRRQPGRAHWLVGLNVYPPILSYRDAMRFPPGMYRAGALAALFAPRTCALISRYASRRAAATTSIAELDQLTGFEDEYGDREDRFFRDFIKPNLADIMLAQARGVWRDCTCLTIPWTERDGRETPIRAAILQNADFPFQPIERIRDLADELALPFEVLPRPYRHFVDEFGDVLDCVVRGPMVDEVV